MQLLLSFLMVFSVFNGLMGMQEARAVEASIATETSSVKHDDNSSTPVNLVVNPGFESGDTGWEFWDDATSVVSNSANSGIYSVKVSAGDTGFAQIITTGVEENESYYFEVYGKVEGGQEGLIFVTCRDSNNQELQTTSFPKFTTASSDYKQRSKTFTAPPGTERIVVWTWTNNATGQYYLDDFLLKKLSGPLPIDNPYPAPPVLPPAEHPRLFVRASDLDEIRSNLAEAEVKEAWDRMLDAAEQSYTGMLPAPISGKNNMNEAIMKTIQAKALLYLLQEDETSGEQAVSMMSNYLDTAVFPLYNYRPIGETLTLGSIVYDWCYPLMTPEQRSHFIQRFVAIAEGMEIGFPPIEQGAVVGHGSEAQLMRDQLSVGIAVYDENPAIYNIVAGRFFAEYVEPRNYVYPSNAQHQGDSYGPYRYQWDVFASWIFKRMGAGNVFNSNQQMTPYEWIYARRPDGQLMRNGDTFQSGRPFGEYWSEPMPNMLPASYYSDSYLKNEFLRQDRYNKSSKEDLWLILFDNPQLVTMNEQTLPLTKYFSEPSGQMTARTGWAGGIQSSTVVATMKVGTTWFANHQHLDAGQFQLYYKGGLAIDSGIYEGINGGYYGAHDLNYNKRTIAHNTMLVYDPNETFPADSNDGGQRFVGDGNEPATINDLDNYKVADVVKHQFGPDAVTPDYSYIKGDLTDAYSSKMEDFKRSFVFLNLKNDEHPAALIVFDKVTSADANFKKTWLLHSENEPDISGDTVTLERTENGYNGKLVNRTLLPSSENAEITKIGGAGNEFFVDGVNYPQEPWSEDSTEAGAWRVEVSPKNKAETDVFLNVMQVMDAVGGPVPLATESIISNEMVGVKIEDRAVLFSKTGVDITSTASFELPASNQDVRVLVTDLSTGYWTVTKAGDPSSVEYEVTPDEGTLYFAANTGGTYTLQHSPTRSLPVPAALATLPLQAEKDALVMQVNGADFAYNSELGLSDGQVIIPYERLADELALTTDLQGSTLTMSRRGTTVAMSISSHAITINGQPATLQTPVTLRNGEVYIPLEVASIAKWATINWDEFSRKVKLSSIQPLTEYKVVEIESSTTANVALQAADGDMNTVWTTSVPGAYLVYDLGETRKFDHIDLAWHNGQDRNYQYQLLTSTDGSNWTSIYTGESFGSDASYEATYFAPVSARFVKLIGNGYHSDMGDSSEISLKEMRIATPYYKIEAVRSSRGKGEEAIDGNLGTMWTSQGKGSWIEFDLGVSSTVAGLSSSWYSGETQLFDVMVSDDQKLWTTVFQGSNSGASGMEDHFFTPIEARYVRLVGNREWNTIWEAVLYKPAATPTPTATSTATPTAAPIATATPTATPLVTPTATPSVTPTPTALPFYNEKVSLDVVKALAEKAKSVQSVTFKDVPKGASFEKTIELATKLGIVKGNADGLFRADASVTRAEFAVMLVRALGLEGTGSSNYKDAKGHWAENEIMTLKSSGIISGYLDGTFQPNQSITRAEMVSMLSKVLNTTSIPKPSKFNDVSGSWAERAIDALFDMGIVNGNSDGSFKPQANATRLESLLVIMRMLNISLGLSLDIE